MGLKVVVTGASSGIGQGIALKFSKDGHEVFAAGRSASRLTETVRLAKEGGGAAVFTGQGDVGVEADVQRNYAEAVKALGGEPDVVVLNAGYAIPSPLVEAKTQDFDDIFNANVRGVFLWLKAIVPAFKKGGSGQIVIINSTLGEEARVPNFSIYTSSKFAVTGLAKALRVELQGSGIKVASVHPGVVDTPLFVAPSWEARGIQGQEMFKVKEASLTTSDVAEAVTTIAYQSSRSDIEKITVRPFAR